MWFRWAEEESEDAAKTDNRIGASRSPLTSLVPDPKRDLVVTAQADPDQKIPRDLDWGRVLAHGEVVDQSEEMILWQSGSSCVGASAGADRLR